MINFYPTSGDKHGWAIDEDLRLIRSSLAGVARETSLSSAHVVHCPFWASLNSHSPQVLACRFVIAHADNPPFFYLTQPSFAKAQQIVDLWVARSTEAKRQFDQLNLPSIHIPYAIDESLFFEIPGKANIRAEFGLPADSYIIGNFHRDSEGVDLSTPKYQKCPEMLVRVCERLIQCGAKIHVLLAGPRRHWIRSALRDAGVPYTFIGQTVSHDDFGINILPRHKLNRLYNACDLYLIPSRWEGGPQSAMEAVACRTKVLSIPLGVGRDILESASLFDTASEAVLKILDDIKQGSLAKTRDPQFQRWKAKHTTSTMTHGIRSMYHDLEGNASYQKKAAPKSWDAFRDFSYRIAQRVCRPLTSPNVDLVNDDGIRIQHVRRDLELMGVTFSESASVRFAGRVHSPAKWANKVAFQFAESDFQREETISGACLVFASVQEAVNYRTGGGNNSVIVCPFSRGSAEQSEIPFMVQESDLQASEAIAEAMGAGRPIVYPENSAYYYQVFHSGVSYGQRRTQQEAAALAKNDIQDFQALAGSLRPMEPFLFDLLK